MKDSMAANVCHQCKKYAEVFNVLPLRRTLSFLLLWYCGKIKSCAWFPLWWNASRAIGKMKSKSCHLCCPATENLFPWSSGGISNAHLPTPSELQLGCLSTKTLLLITGKSVVGDWTPGVQGQSMFRAVTPQKTYSGGQRLMGSCGNEMGGWVNWLCAARTEKGCAARRREVTSNYCQKFTADVQKDLLHAGVVLKCTFSKLFGIFSSNQTVWNNSDK